MFKRIMVATDGSPTSEKAVETALGLKRLVPEAEVIVIHVSEMPPKTILEPGTERPHGLVALPDSTKANLTRESDEILERARAIADRSGFRVKFYKRSGDPASLIVQEAERLGCDLIVVGGRGAGGLEAFLGSVSSRVANRFRGSVLIVR
jgi:nucleotide-binding universal stress UspA family protein